MKAFYSYQMTGNCRKTQTAHVSQEVEGGAVLPVLAAVQVIGGCTVLLVKIMVEA